MSVTRLPPCAPAKRASADQKLIYHMLAVVVVTIMYGLVTFKHGRSIFYSTYVNTTTTAFAPLASKSPLQELSELLWLDTPVVSSLSDEDTLHEIESKAALNMKFLAIPETVYTQKETSQLYSYVETQLLHAKDVVTPKQAEMVLKLIESGVAQGSMMKKEMGFEGSLKNFMVVAILKEHEGNVHFMMAGVSLEPRLGWRRITKQRRNAWNDAVSRMLHARLKQEMGTLIR